MAGGRRMSPCAGSDPPASSLRLRWVQGIDGLEVLERNLLPQIQGRAELRRVLRGRGQDVRPLDLEIPPLVAGLNDGVERHPVRRSPRGVPPWVAKRSTAELEDCVVAEDGEESRHVSDVDPAGG